MQNTTTLEASDMVPVPATALVRIRQILGRLPYDEVGTLPAEIDRVCREFDQKKKALDDSSES